jgi:hypothetical protein
MANLGLYRQLAGPNAYVNRMSVGIVNRCKGISVVQTMSVCFANNVVICVLLMKPRLEELCNKILRSSKALEASEGFDCMYEWSVDVEGDQI